DFHRLSDSVVRPCVEAYALPLPQENDSSGAHIEQAVVSSTIAREQGVHRAYTHPGSPPLSRHNIGILCLDNGPTCVTL
ncbi:unnamed protein product, partial [Amoebophrya sp. A25]